MTRRAEYQRGIMDAISDPGVERVVIMTSAQVGKTEMLNNVVGFHIAQDPAPILVLQPTLEMAETWSKDRLAPMLRDTPALRDRVADPRARDSGNTMLHKRFAGGHVTVVGANSPSSLASRPIRIVLADEVKRLRTALAKIADWDSNWGPFPENNEAWRAMAVVTAREAVPELGPNVFSTTSPENP